MHSTPASPEETERIVNAVMTDIRRCLDRRRIKAVVRTKRNAAGELVIGVIFGPFGPGVISC